MDFEKLSSQGNQADDLYEQEKFPEAESIYRDIVNTMETDGEVDAFLLSKSVLGILITLIHQEKFTDAFTVWSSNRTEDILGLGISGLEQDFQVSVHDAAVYLMVSAFFYSLGDDEPDTLAEVVTDQMSRLMDYLIDHEAELIPQAVSNWKNHLLYIYDESNVPEQFLETLHEYEDRLEEDYPLIDIKFPRPALWELNPEELSEEEVIG